MAPVIRATLDDNTTTPLVSPSRCAKAYVSPGVGSTPCKGGPLPDNAFTLAANLGFRRSGPYITDTINGYRAITRQAVETLKLDAVDYTIEYQMTIRCLKQGMRIVEFPTVEGRRIAGDTGAPAIPTGLRFLRCLGRETFIRRARRRAFLAAV